jgi:hypothetical protein
MKHETTNEFYGSLRNKEWTYPINILSSNNVLSLHTSPKGPNGMVSELSIKEGMITNDKPHRISTLQ